MMVQYLQMDRSAFRLDAINILGLLTGNRKYIEPAELSESKHASSAEMLAFVQMRKIIARCYYILCCPCHAKAPDKPRYSVPMQPLLAAALLLG